VVDLLGSRGEIWLIGLVAGLVILVVAYTFGPGAAALLALPVALAGTAAVRVRDRVWILRRRIVVMRDPISRRQLLAIMIAVSIVAGLTSGLGWFFGSSVLGSYDERLKARSRKKKKTPDAAR
jgi:hypothetical protein